MRTRRSFIKTVSIVATFTTFLLAGCTEIAQDLGLVERKLGGADGPAPRASFSMTYDSQNERVTVSHDGGADIPAANVYVRGTGLNQTGSWINLRGDTSMDNGVEIINAGSVLRVAASPDYSARVVWDSGEDSKIYAESTGPEGR